MATTIYWFSGTGNSLWVARSIAAGLSDVKLVPVVAALTDASEEIEEEADVVGFVFPVHAFSLPSPVRELLARIRLVNKPYLFAVATRGGSPCRVFHHVDRLLQREDRRLDARFFVDMPVTWLLYWDVPTEKEFAEIDAKARETVDRITAVVRDRCCVTEYEHAPWILERVLFPLAHAMSTATRFFRLEDAFYSEPHCTGCGLCAELCPAGKISMVDGRPEWDKEVKCTFCLACIHNCPHRAIQLSRTKSVYRGRYRHPEVSRADIAGQKGAPAPLVDAVMRITR
jgi:ferredoxin